VASWICIAVPHKAGRLRLHSIPTFMAPPLLVWNLCWTSLLLCVQACCAPTQAAALALMAATLRAPALPSTFAASTCEPPTASGVGVALPAPAVSPLLLVRFINHGMKAAGSC